MLSVNVVGAMPAKRGDNVKLFFLQTAAGGLLGNFSCNILMPRCYASVDHKIIPSSPELTPEQT